MSKSLAGVALSKRCEVQHDLMSVLTIWGFFDTLKSEVVSHLAFYYRVQYSDSEVYRTTSPLMVRSTLISLIRSGETAVGSSLRITRSAAARYGLGYDLVAGANIAGFQKVADAMMAQGVF